MGPPGPVTGFPFFKKNEKLARGRNAEVFRETLAVNFPHLFTLRHSESLVRITLKAKHLELNA
jgi:hypothetical protein